MHVLYKNYICNWLRKIRFFLLSQAQSQCYYSLPQSSRIEWFIFAGSLIQQTSKEMPVWLLFQLCGVDIKACAGFLPFIQVIMSSVWFLQVYPIFTFHLHLHNITNQYQCLHIGNTTSYCRAFGILCRVMDTFEAIIRCAVALLILCNSFLFCLKKKLTQAPLWLLFFSPVTKTALMERSFS